VARGLQQAGFNVTGVDIESQANYCGDVFIQADAIEYLKTADISQFDFIWASPPCQAYTSIRHAPGEHRNADLVGPTRDALKRAGRPYCIENVIGAPLVDPIQLCGTMFRLATPDGAFELQRHRLFEASFPIAPPCACRHGEIGVEGTIGIYGGHFRNRKRAEGTNHRSGSNIPREHGFHAMGVPSDAMTVAEISDAIPPAYSKWIAEQFLAQAPTGAHDVLKAPPPVRVNGSHYSAIQSNLRVDRLTPGTLDDTCVDPARVVFADFETGNTGGCDLTKAGAWRYAADPATEILCFGFRIDGVDHSWSPSSNAREPLAALAANPDVLFACFGSFEQAVWSQIMVARHRFLPIPTGRWLDLRAVASSLALPRSLDKALTALGLPIEKDKEGQRLIRSLSRPDRKTGLYPKRTPQILERVAKYNRIDILALEAMCKQGLGRLSASEQPVWELDQKINERGIAIDIEFVQAAKRISDQVMVEAIEEFRTLTNGISPSQVQRIREWLRDNRYALPNLEAETVVESLEAPGLPDNVRRVLEIRQITAAASLKKLDAMLACVGPDGRARGLLQYHGATTGRWSGQLIQPQNFPRPSLEADVDQEELAAAVKSGDPEQLSQWGKPIDVLVSSLRCALTAAEGKVLAAGDFSMIECCVLLALAGQHDKCELITQGVDVYRDMATTIYGLDRAAFMAIPEDQLSPEETERRRIGKNGVLSSGYGIGAECFYRRFCRHVEGGRELAVRIVGVYRHQWAPAVPRLWRDLEWTARRAMQRPGQPAVARCGVVYQLTTCVGLPCLICALPNGKLLHYANARIEGADKWGRPRWVYNAYRQGQWREVTPYGGQLTENVASALARELLVDRMFALEAAGYPIVFTVHDEIVVEHPDIAKEAMERIMSQQPKWAEKLGVPVKAKAWVGKRYQ
jgi:DNA polymerase